MKKDYTLKGKTLFLAIIYNELYGFEKFPKKIADLTENWDDIFNYTAEEENVLFLFKFLNENLPNKIPQLSGKKFILEFSGYGDGGNEFGIEENELKKTSSELIEEYCEQFEPFIGYDYCNKEGGQGQLIFDLETKTISLEGTYNETVEKEVDWVPDIVITNESS